MELTLDQIIENIKLLPLEDQVRWHKSIGKAIIENGTEQLNKLKEDVIKKENMLNEIKEG